MYVALRVVDPIVTARLGVPPEVVTVTDSSITTEKVRELPVGAPVGE
jgi:hypothetical protein